MKKKSVANHSVPTSTEAVKQERSYTPQSRHVVPLHIASAGKPSKKDLGEEHVTETTRLTMDLDANPHENTSTATAERMAEKEPKMGMGGLAGAIQFSAKTGTTDMNGNPPHLDNTAHEEDVLYQVIKQGSLFVQNEYQEKEKKVSAHAHPPLDEQTVMLAPDRILDLDEVQIDNRTTTGITRNEKSLFALAGEQDAQPYLPKNAQEAFYLVAPGLNEDRQLMQSMGRLLQDIASEPAIPPENRVRPVQIPVDKYAQLQEEKDRQVERLSSDLSKEAAAFSVLTKEEETFADLSKETDTYELKTAQIEKKTSVASDQRNTSDVATTAASGTPTAAPDTSGTPTAFIEDLPPAAGTTNSTDEQAEEIAVFLSRQLAATVTEEKRNAPETQRPPVPERNTTAPVLTNKGKIAHNTFKKWIKEKYAAGKKQKSERLRLSNIQLATTTRAKRLAQNTLQEAGGFLYFLCLLPAATLLLLQYRYTHNMDHSPLEIVLSYGLGNLLLYGLALVTPMIILLKKHSYSFTFILGKHTPSPATLVLSGLITLPVLLLLTGVNHIINYGMIYFRLTSIQTEWLTDIQLIQRLPGTSHLLLTIILFGLLEPILEELFFRGFLQSMFCASNRIRLAVILQALAYALYKPQPLFWLFPLFTGLFLGYLRYSMQSLWPALIGHILLNLGTIFLYLSLPVFIADPLLVGTKTGAAALQAAVVTVVLAVLILLPTLRLLRHFQPQEKSQQHSQKIQPATPLFYLSCFGFLLLKLFL